MNRLSEILNHKKSDILNIYFTAGFPNLEDTASIIASLNKEGVDIIELGVPYSDPLADGLTIQQSSAQALKNGIHLDLIFDQLQEIKEPINSAIVMMGYYNQFLQYGMEKLLAKMKICGVSGLIIPDLPIDYYLEHHQDSFKEHNIAICFLITPETPESRIRKIDAHSSGFVYMVAQSSITGSKSDIDEQQIRYFEYIDNLNLKTDRLIGFGIHDHKSYRHACNHANGAIIGSAFIRHLDEHGIEGIPSFVRMIRNES